jgi:hypothetical protein
LHLVPSPIPANRFPLVAWLERRSRRQAIVAGIVVATYLAFRGARSLAGVVLDRWWLRSVTDVPVWSTITWARLLLATVAGIVTAVVLGGTLWLVQRRGEAPIDDVGGIVRRYRNRMGPAHRWLLVAIAAIVTIRIAAAANSHWQEWLLFRHGDDLDRSVPELGGDLGYYLFKLPLLSVVSTWVRQVLLLAFGLAAFASWISGGIRMSRNGERSQRQALAHLGLLGALFAGAQALDYVFVRRPDLATNRAGSFVGPGYTELRVGVSGTWILALVAVVVGFLLVWSVRTDRWRPAAIALGAWALLHLIVVIAVPALSNRFLVAPAEAARQLPYLAHNLDATREAFSLDSIEQSNRVVRDGLPAGFDSTDDALDRVPVFDATRLTGPLQVLQGRTATRITDVDLDRYEADGELRPVMVAARSSSRGDLPEHGWVQEHLVYTHGDGVVAVPADRPDSDGRPDVDALASSLTPERSELYFGEGVDGWYAIVGTKREEQGGTAFGADTGIDVSSVFQRSVLALATGDIEPLFSAELTSDSQLLYRRGVGERLSALMPFATFGGDPYPVVTERSVVWVVDGYTTSSTFPYSQYVGFGGGDDVNYVHASLKATVDAYDGTVHVYRTEVGGADDPILDAWEEIFPGLIEPIASMPAALQAHLLYPPELLTIQTQLVGRYHVDSAEALFNGTQRWSPSAAASTSVGTGSPGTATPVQLFVPDGGFGDAGHWASAVPFSPGAGSGTSSARDRLAAIAVADNDANERIDLIAIDAEPGRDVSTPLVAQSAIDADPAVAQLITLLNANGSQVEFGPMTPLVLEDGLVWVRSIIVSGTNTTTAPRLYGVLAVSNGLVGSGDDVPAAIADAVAQAGDD